jgi:hypothetical protein
MKKIGYSIVIFALALVHGYAQETLSSDYAYKASEPYSTFYAREKLYFAQGNEVLALKIDEKEVLIQKFNSNKPAFIKAKKYQKYFPKNFSFETALEMDGKYYFFYFSWDADKGKEQLFALEIDFATGEFTGEHRLILEIDGKVTGRRDYSNGSFFTDENRFAFFQSHDRKSVLIKYRKQPEIKRDTKSFDIIGVFAFDNSLNRISGNEVTMPYTERRMNNMDFQLDNKGNLYLLARVFHDDSNDFKKKRKDTIANYHIELLIIKAGSAKVDISRFENKDKFINKLWLFDTEKDFLVAGGFYSNGVKNDLDDCDGIVTFKVKEDGIIYDKAYYEIPLEVLNEYEGAYTRKKNAKDEVTKDNAKFSDLDLHDIAVNADGSILLVGEEHFVTSYANVNHQAGSRSTVRYFYCDILAVKINSDGSLGWMKKIPKKQVGGNGLGGMSYKYFNAGGNHYLVYLDNVKNINLPLDKEPKVHQDGSGGYLTAVKIADADGALTKGSVLNSRDVEDFNIYQFSTERIVKTSENSFLLEVYKKKKEDIMIKVDLK